MDERHRRKGVNRPPRPSRADRRGRSTPGCCAYARSTRRFLVLLRGRRAASPPCWSSPRPGSSPLIVAGAFVQHRSARLVAYAPDRALWPSSPAGPSWPGRPSAPRTGPRPRPSPSCGGPRSSTSPPWGRPGSSARDPGKLGVLLTTGARRPGRLLLPLPAPAVPGRHRPGHRHRRRGRRRLDQCRAHRGHRPAHPAVHGAGRRHHQGPDGAPACARCSGWPATSSTSWPGLPTLKVFGRAKAQARAIREVTDRYRSATMATLRLAFLSSLILELLATISVALVAVAVGLRLLGGHMSLRRRPLRARPRPRGLPAPPRSSAPTTTPAPTA